MGDAIVALWNAPREQPDHALQACRAALGALAALDASSNSGPAVRFGFGICSGPAVAGNIGAVGRLEYTVIGETVNVASRLSGAAGGGEVWVGERTFQLVREHLQAEPMPPQQLKGMSAPVAAYRLVRDVPVAAARVVEPAR